MSADVSGDAGGEGRLRVVVTGASGNVGTSVLEALAAHPRVGSVLGIARRTPRWSPARTEWARADLGQEGATADLTGLFEGADAVVHLAWLIQPTHAPLTTWRTNVLGTERVLRAMAAAGVPALVYSSSVGAYAPGPTAPGSGPVDESWPTHGWPQAAYTREKAYVERLLDTFERDHPGIRVVRMRPSFMFKEHSAMEQRRLFMGPLLPHRLVRPGVVPVVPDLPGLTFQALHTDDAADAFTRAVVGDAAGAFNLAAGPPVDAATLAGLLSARVVRVPRPAVRTALAVAWRLRAVPASPYLFDAFVRLPLMDTGRARRELDWTPRRTGPETLAEFLRGLREGRGMDTPTLTGRLPGGRLREAATNLAGRP
ncbi:NAD-dependent epimerase/dehydratase family protein [Streptomyces sp. TRM 70351]|uniref:NAD-dependent epimerase/dehydratase family protein n=1 Tax=Streptomyces sp. TRM 70351 TaxID=3116552 RepID=UPI002E7B8931|nr:NAD-dependent epimerase/dehydratase family protein [Streptomyces sp. TRM 70351]MEE1927028.1 NAD-dependent epimerase/dehydratase family protein [Streptomyces sp. TRM 70351]